MPEKSIYEEDKCLTLYLEEAALSEPLSAEQERELSERIRKGDLEARDKLVKANLKFVINVAKQYQNLGLDLSDLINEGNIGLIEAANRFDGNKGFKFISYAVWWVRQAILQALADQGRTMRLPLNRAGLLIKINKTAEYLRQELENEPSPEQIAVELGLDAEEVRATLADARKVWSLDAVFDNDDDERSLFSLLEDKSSPAPDAKVVDESVKEAIRKAIDELSEKDKREAQVIRLHFFGADGGEPMTLDEIGKRLKLTRQRVEQIENKALRRLRHPTRRYRLAQALGDHELMGAAVPPLTLAVNNQARLKALELKASRPRDNKKLHPDARAILTRIHILLKGSCRLTRLHKMGGIHSARALIALIEQEEGQAERVLRRLRITNPVIMRQIEKEYQNFHQIQERNDMSGTKVGRDTARLPKHRFPQSGSKREQPKTAAPEQEGLSVIFKYYLGDKRLKKVSSAIAQLVKRGIASSLDLTQYIHEREGEIAAALSDLGFPVTEELEARIKEWQQRGLSWSNVFAEALYWLNRHQKSQEELREPLQSNEAEPAAEQMSSSGGAPAIETTIPEEKGEDEQPIPAPEPSVAINLADVLASPEPQAEPRATAVEEKAIPEWAARMMVAQGALSETMEQKEEREMATLEEAVRQVATVIDTRKLN